MSLVNRKGRRQAAFIGQLGIGKLEWSKTRQGKAETTNDRQSCSSMDEHKKTTSVISQPMDRRVWKHMVAKAVRKGI